MKPREKKSANIFQSVTLKMKVSRLLVVYEYHQNFKLRLRSLIARNKTRNPLINRQSDGNLKSGEGFYVHLPDKKIM